MPDIEHSLWVDTATSKHSNEIYIYIYIYILKEENFLNHI